MIDSVVDLVEEQVDLGWFSIFWINSRTLVLCACFTTECGSPGIRKSMSASFTIIDPWLTSWSATDLSVFLRSTSSSRFWELSDTLVMSCMLSGRPDLSRIGFRVGWFDWKLLDSCPTSGRWACSEPNSLFHFVFEWDLWRRSRSHVYFFRIRLLQFSF